MTDPNEPENETEDQDLENWENEGGAVTSEEDDEID